MESYNKKSVYGICLISALGGLLFGYDWVVIGGAKPFYESFFSISDNPSLQGLAMSIALIGCLIGALLCGSLADYIGRKKLLLIAAFIFFVSSWWTGAVNQFNEFLFARFLCGAGIGLASGLSPMYIAEIAPTSIRGKLVSLNQLMIVIGILSAQITNWLIAEDVSTIQDSGIIISTWNEQMAWRWMFWAAMFPSAVFFMMIFMIPESPRWLIFRGQKEKAVHILSQIGGPVYAMEESRLIEALCKGDRKQRRLTTLFQSPYRKILLIGVVIAFFQQWCGTNVIFNYAQEIFQAAGYSIGDMLFNIVITGIANLALTIVAIFTVERWGRKLLMCIGSCGLGIIYLLLGICYYFEVSGLTMVLFVVMAIACYAMTLGPVTWVLLAEIFPNRIRGIAVATCTFVLWIGSATLTYSFPLLNSNLGISGTFGLYSIVCLLGFLFIFYKVPETKGYTLEEIEQNFINENK